MTAAESQPVETKIQTGSYQDLQKLAQDLKDLADINPTSQKELQTILIQTSFTNRVIAAIEQCTGEQSDTNYLRSDETDSIGLFTGQVVGRWSNEDGSIRHLDLSGQRRNNGLFDYAYTIRMGIWPYHTAGLRKDERDQLDDRKPVLVRYFKDSDVVNCSDDRHVNEALKVIQIALEELSVTTQNIEQSRRRVNLAVDYAKRRISDTLGSLATSLNR